jgi:hypothetical protein
MDTSTTKPGSLSQGMDSPKAGSNLRSDKPAAEPSAPGDKETKSQSGSLLGADGKSIPIAEDFADTVADRGRELGRRAEDSWKRVSSAAQELAEQNPTRTALTALGVGILVGAVIGAILARD